MKKHKPIPRKTTGKKPTAAAAEGRAFFNEQFQPVQQEIAALVTEIRRINLLWGNLTTAITRVNRKLDWLTRIIETKPPSAPVEQVVGSDGYE
jgi:hypothetical protein